MQRLNIVLVLVGVLMLGLALSPTHPVSAGIEGLPPCSNAVHASYVTTGPDGKSYATWHPQFDIVRGCYHSHEHGTNPDMFLQGYRPAYGYTASKHMMNEPHVGFKNYVFDDGFGRRWLVVHHFGTSGLGRACERFHTVDIAVVSSNGGSPLAEVHFLGDFGEAISSVGLKPLTPNACPHQSGEARAAGSTGQRRIPVKTEGTITYEPWRMDRRTIPGIQFVNGYGMTFNTRHPIVGCKDLTCNEVAPTAAGHGNLRIFKIVGMFGFPSRPATDPASGTFYTDPMGQKLLSENDPHAVKQYIQANADLVIPADPNKPVRFCSPVESFSMFYQCYFDTSIVVPTAPYVLNRWISANN